MSVVEQVKKFVEPRSVALFGVSRRAGEHAFNILENLLSYGYQGRIYPVHPSAAEILGVKAYSRVADIGDEIDLAVINLSRDLVPGIVKECIEQGIQAIVIVSQGFSDATDEEGKRLQEEIGELIRRSGVRILGPNTFGTANPFINFSSSFMKLDMVKMPVGIICQSGIFYAGFPEARFLGKGIDLGNACDVDFADGLEYFEQDDEVRVVGLHIEGVRDGRGFIEVARRLAQRKPVLALKTGWGKYAAQAVQSHTGSLVGEDATWEAVFRQSGVIRVSDIDELGDSVRGFSVLPPMKGGRVGVVSSSGAVGIMSIDACDKFNLEVARLSPVEVNRVSGLFPSWQSIGNPLDIWPPIGVSKYSLTEVVTEVTDTILSDYEVDAVCFIWWVWTHQICNDLYQILAKLAKVHQDKPIVCCLFGAYAEEARNRLEATGRIMVCHTPDRAIRVLGHLARYSAFRRGL